MGASMESLMSEMERKLAEEEIEKRAVKRMCLYCGKPLAENPRGRKKKFCSDRCRSRWHSAHPNPQNWSSTRTAVCPCCGREFLASRETTRIRKYCSRACANRARAKKRGEGRDEAYSRTEDAAGPRTEAGGI